MQPLLEKQSVSERKLHLFALTPVFRYKPTSLKRKAHESLYNLTMN